MKSKNYIKQTNNAVIKVKQTKKRTKNNININAAIQNFMNKKLEKKRTDITYATVDYAFGQVNGNVNGYHAEEITPSPSVGSQLNQRNGNQISITGMYMSLQLRQMSACQSPVTIVFYIMRFKGDYSSTAAQTVGNCFNANEYVGGGGIIYDTQSSFNTDFFGAFKILKKVKCYLKPDQITGQQMPLSKNVALKFKKPLNVRYFGSSGTTASQGKIFLIGFANNGNRSTGTASLLTNIPIGAINTGIFLNYNIKYYYTDA